MPEFEDLPPLPNRKLPNGEVGAMSWPNAIPRLGKLWGTTARVFEIIDRLNILTNYAAHDTPVFGPKGLTSLAKLANNGHGPAKQRSVFSRQA
jgi:hypothetical protein